MVGLVCIYFGRAGGSLWLSRFVAALTYFPCDVPQNSVNWAADLCLQCCPDDSRPLQAFAGDAAPSSVLTEAAWRRVSSELQASEPLSQIFSDNTSKIRVRVGCRETDTHPRDPQPSIVQVFLSQPVYLVYPGGPDDFIVRQASKKPPHKKSGDMVCLLVNYFHE